jgi:NDP-sugar pyrophosphorylase family protein
MSVGEEGLVTRFEEKPAVADIGRGFDKANAAVFCIEREALVAAIDGGARDFSRDVFEPGVTSGMPVYGIDIGSGYRFDVGGISRWYELNMRALRGELRFARPGREIAPGAWLGERSEAAGSSLLPSCLIGDGVEVSEGSTIGPDAIIGNGCRIGRGSRIARSIVMEGCEIGSDAVIEESVIGPSCAIEAGSRIPPRTILGPYSSYGGNSWRNLARSPEYRYG